MITVNDLVNVTMGILGHTNLFQSDPWVPQDDYSTYKVYKI